MEVASGSAQSAQNLTIAITAASTLASATTTITTVVGTTTATSSSTLLTASGSNSSSSAVVSVLTSKQQQQQTLQLDAVRPDQEANNSSLASAFSEGQRSLSGAPSASSSPILSPPGKIYGRNANGTMIATSRPSNEAEIQLYRVLQRASLLAYYDTLLEMGGDDVQQLYEAGEEEFLEIMALVGMASKPLHVRRLQKVLHEWANNPTLFQGPMIPGGLGFCDTPTKPVAIFHPDATRTKFSSIAHTFNPTPLISTAQTSTSTSATHSLPQLPTPITPIPSIIPHPALSLSTATLAAAPSTLQISGGGGATTHQVSSSSPLLTPVLTELQVARITLGAEKIARQLPQREPRAQTSKKRTSRELEQVIAMSENDPRRMDEIRKYSAIYGRFDCKRRPEKPLTLHEVCVNEAAAQLCRLVPALLTRRDELFPLARQIVKDAGFGHSASIARYGGLVPQMQAQQSLPRSGVIVGDCESSDSTLMPKRQRLSSTDNSTTSDLNRDNLEDPRYNLFAMYQKFAKQPPFDLSDITKYSLCKSDFEDNDNDNDNDSRFSFSNSSSPSLPQNNGSEHEREFNESGVVVTNIISDAAMKSPNLQQQLAIQSTSNPTNSPHGMGHIENCLPLDSNPGVQVISAAGGHIIAVANPALALSPTLNEALSIKREIDSPGV